MREMFLMLVLVVVAVDIEANIGIFCCFFGIYDLLYDL